jgi:hypothetical protein
MALAVELGVFNANFSGFDQRIRCAQLVSSAPCGCAASPIRRFESCKTP